MDTIMCIIIGVICFLIILKYGFVLAKFLKTGEFKKKKYIRGKAYVGNIIGVIAYTCITIVIVSLLILMILISQDKKSDLIMWFIFIFGIFALLAYPIYWLARASDKAKEEKTVQLKQVADEFIEKYGDPQIYDVLNFDAVDCYSDEKLDDKTVALVVNTDKMPDVQPDSYYIEPDWETLSNENRKKLYGNEQTTG